MHGIDTRVGELRAERRAKADEEHRRQARCASIALAGLHAANRQLRETSYGHMFRAELSRDREAILISRLDDGVEVMSFRFSDQNEQEQLHLFLKKMIDSVAGSVVSKPAPDEFAFAAQKLATYAIIAVAAVFAVSVILAIALAAVYMWLILFAAFFMVSIFFGDS